MAKLPQYRQQVVSRTATPSAAPVDNSLSQGINQAVQGASQFAQVQAQMQERESRDYVIGVSNDIKPQLAEKKVNLTKTVKTGSEYTQGINDYLDERKQQAMENAPNRKAAEAAGQYYESLKSNEMENAIGVAAKINADNTANTIRTALTTASNDTYQNPSSYNTNLETVASIIQTSDLSETQKEQAIQNQVNELTVRRFQGTISDNPYQAKKELDSGEWNDKLKPDQLITLTNQADQQIKSRNQAQKQKVTTEIQDYLSYKQAGGQNKKPFDETQLKAIYGDEKGGQIYSAIADAESFADNFGQVELASADELPALMQSETVTGPEDFNTQSAQQSTMYKAIQERNKQLSNDPALYSMKSPNVQKAAEEWQATGDGTNYASTTISEQTRLGVPTELVSVLSDKQAESIVQSYNQGGEDAYTMISDLKNQFGDYFPVVMRDLNRSGLSPHASMVSVLDPSAGQYLSQADKTGFKVMKENIGNDTYTLLQDGIKGLVDREFSSTINGTPAGITLKNQVQKSTELLAMYYLDSGMVDDSGEAVTKAYQDTIDSRYTFQDSYRVPVKIGNYSPDALKIEDSLDTIMDSVREMDLMPPYDPSLPHEQRLEVYKSRLDPKWQTRGDDAGVELVDQNQQAVLKADGTKIFYPWNELEGMSQENKSWWDF